MDEGGWKVEIKAQSVLRYLMKGNFVPKKKVTVKEEKGENLETRFEREALKRIGGSIAFVSKQKVKWDYEEKSNRPKSLG